MKINEDLRISWSKSTDALHIRFHYSQFIHIGAGLHMLFSTEQLAQSMGGFLKISRGFYIKLEIRPLDKKYKRREVPEDLLKVSVNPEKEVISWIINPKSVFAAIVNGDIRVYSSSLIPNEQLHGFYYNLIVYDHHPQKLKQLDNSNDNNNQLKAKDIGYNDHFKYNTSPNTDSPRNQKEYLAGTGSNIGRNK